MFQSRSSSTKSAHANAEPSVSGHRLDTGSKSIEFVGRKKEFFSVRKKMGLRLFLRDWNNFAAKTEIGIALEYFCRMEVGLTIFLSEEKREEELDLENFCPKKQKGERELDLK